MRLGYLPMLSAVAFAIANEKSPNPPIGRVRSIFIVIFVDAPMRRNSIVAVRKNGR